MILQMEGQVGYGDLTTTNGAFQETTDSSDFYLIIIEDNANTLSYATFFGGNLAAEHVDGGTAGLIGKE